MQRTVAEQLRVRVETVGLWENGLARPLPRHYGSIVRFLGYDPEPGDLTVAGRLRAVRRRLGLSQAEFAAKVGLDEGSVCRWESGSRQPSSWMAGRVAMILDHLEKIAGQHAAIDGGDVGTLPLTYFDRTRWRRRPPTALTDGEAVTIGDRLRRRRLELGLSQVQLGKQLGVGRATVYRWERGECVPRGARANGLDRFLKRAPTRSRRPPVDRGHESGSDSD
jgi:transcriptional regulator with XRE-family HTH domain